MELILSPGHLSLTSPCLLFPHPVTPFETSESPLSTSWPPAPRVSDLFLLPPLPPHVGPLLVSDVNSHQLDSWRPPLPAGPCPRWSLLSTRAQLCPSPESHWHPELSCEVSPQCWGCPLNDSAGCAGSVSQLDSLLVPWGVPGRPTLYPSSGFLALGGFTVSPAKTPAGLVPFCSVLASGRQQCPIRQRSRVWGSNGCLLSTHRVPGMLRGSACLSH